MSKKPKSINERHEAIYAEVRKQVLYAAKCDLQLDDIVEGFNDVMHANDIDPLILRQIRNDTEGRA